MSSLKLTNIGQLITYDSEVNEMLTHENVEVAIEKDQIVDIGKDLGPLESEKLTILAALSITDGLFQMKEDEEALSRQVTATIESMVERLEKVILEE